MGAHFGSIQIRTDDVSSVRKALEAVAKETDCKLLVGPPVNGWISTFPIDSGLNEQISKAIAKRLSNDIFHLIVHDDSIFAYFFYRGGRLVDRYNSCPDYFDEVSDEEKELYRGHPVLFQDLLPSPGTLTKLEALLAPDTRDKFIYEQTRMRQFAKLLGLSNALSSYEYLQSGERTEIEGWNKFIHIPDQSAEKAARKEAAEALRRKKMELKKTGLFCNEWLPPCNRKDAIFSIPDYCADPITGGFLVLWRRCVGFGYSPQLHCLRPPWVSKVEPMGVNFLTTSPDELVIHPKGDLIAFRDKGLRLWNRSEKQPDHDFQLDAKPIAFSGDGEMLLCQSGDGFKDPRKFIFVSLKSKTVLQTVQPEFSTGDVLELHPSNRFLLTRPTENQLGIIDFQSSPLSKVVFSEANPNAPDFMTAVQETQQPELRAHWPLTGIGRGVPKIMNAHFSPDGKLLFCATTLGLRVYSWVELLASTGEMPKAKFSITLIPEALQLDLIHSDNYVYDVVFDEEKNRLLFSGIPGTINFLNLNDGKSGIFIDPPGKSPMWKLTLSHDRKFICCLCTPPAEDRNNKPPRLQVWDYQIACKNVGP